MQVLRSKIAIPGLPRQFVSRPRLLAALDAVPTGAVRLVCAPPGFGKSLLLVDWVSASRSLDTAWVNLDTEDNDEQRLWAAVLAALATCAAVPAGRELRRLAGLPLDGQPDVVAAIVDALDVLPSPVRLVLDNVDQLNETGALRGLEQLIRHRPAGLQLVLASRLDPPVALHRLRLEGRLSELRAEDLRFSLPEAEALLAKSGLHLSHARAVVLHTGTEGWVAGLSLAAVSIGNAGDPDQFLAMFPGNDRAVADYLVGEVLTAFSPEMRELLSVLSVCSPLPPALAIELTGREDAAQQLEWLGRETALISAGRHHKEYGIHSLLGSYLRTELNSNNPSLVTQLHATAARWWAAQRRPVEALHHARHTGDAAELTALLREVAIPLILTGQHVPLRRALVEIGEGVVAGDPWLAAAWALTGEPRGAAARANPAEPWAMPGRPELRTLRAIAELAQAQARAQVDPAAAWLAQSDPATEALSRFAAGTGQLGPGGDQQIAREELQAALRLARTHAFDYLTMLCEVILARLAAWDGDHPEMVAASRRAASVADARGWQRSAWAGTAQLLLAYAALLRAETEAARSLADDAIAAGGDPIDPDLRFGLRVVLGAAIFDSGDGLAGLREMQQARAELGDRPLAPEQAAAPALLEYRAALVLGYAPAAATVLSWLAERAGTPPESQLIRAWADVSAGNHAAARDRLRPLLEGSARPLLPYTDVEAWVLATELALAAGDRPAARHALRAALTRAQLVDVLRPFTWASPVLRELLVHQLGSFGPAEPTAARALAALRHVDARPATRPLSERELETLALLPSLLSLADIASELEISINTVKSHIRAIYTKLDVNTRRAAIVIAHRRGLLPGTSRPTLGLTLQPAAAVGPPPVPGGSPSGAAGSSRR